MSTPKRPKRPADFNQRAYQVFQEAIGEAYEESPVEDCLIGEEEIESTPLKNPAAVELGKLGGSKGGKARAIKLTAERRAEIARAAALARWNKIDKQTKD